MKMPSLHLALPNRRQLRRPVKKTAALSLVALTIISLALPLVGLIMPLSSVQAASWWNEDYRYRQQIDITSPTTQTNVYTTLTLDTSDTTKFKNDCSDLKFIDFNNQTIPYYIASGCGTASTSVQLLFSSLPTGTTSIYLYYGNPLALTSAVPQAFNNPATGISTAFQTEEKAQAPIASWKLDEGYGTTTHSSTAKEYSGTISGAAWQQSDQCVSGQCLNFDGIDDRVTFGNSIDLSGGKPFTLQMWIKPAVLPATNWSRIFSYEYDNGQRQGMLIYQAQNTNNICFEMWRDGVNKGSNCLTASKGAIWLNMAVVFTGSQIILYQDGAYKGAVANDTQLLPHLQSLSIGSHSYNNFFFRGSIDQPKIYDYARSQQQIQQDYVTGKQQMATQQSNLSDGLVGYWNMDEIGWNGTTGEIKDRSGNTNNGTAIGGASTTSGKIGQAANLDGIDDSLSIPSIAINNLSLSYSFWVNVSSSISGQRDIVGCSGGQVYAQSNGIRAGYCNNAGSQFGTSSLQLDSWQYVSVVFENATSRKMYLNGILVATNTATVSGATAINTLGARSSAQFFFPGKLDEFRIYNRAITSQEVAQLYNYAPKPVAYYDFENGTSSVLPDVSGNGNNASWVAGSSYASGKVGKSGLFDGTTVRATIAASDNSILDGERGFTWGLWLKRSANSLNQWPIILGQSDTHSGYGIRSQDYGDNISFEYGQAPYNGSSFTNIACGGSSLPINEWHYFTAVYDGQNLKFYRDGQQCGSTVTVVLNPTFSQLYLSRNTQLFAGQIDEIKLYNYARTEDQIIQDMQSATSPMPVGWWRMDEGQGTTVHNSGWSGSSSMDATLINMSNPATTTSGWTANGKVNGAANFDYSDDFANIGNPSAAKIKSSLTISAWINPASIGATNARGILSKYSNTDGNRGYNFGIAAAGRLALRLSDDGTTNYTAYSNTYLTAGKWWHVAVVFSANEGKVSIYVNGLLDKVTTGFPSSIFNSPRNLQIGRWDADSGGVHIFDGTIDEVKLYNLPLTAQQIAADYNQSSSIVMAANGTQTTTTQSGANATQPSSSTDAKYCVPGSTDYCTKPVGEWNFEEGDGSVVKDVSGNNNNANWSGSSQHYISGKNGKAGNFQQENSDKVTATNSPSLNSATSQITLSAWIKPKSIASNTNFNIVAKENYGSMLGYRLVLSGNSGKQNQPLLVIGNGTNNISPDSNINLSSVGKWYYLVATFDAGTVRYYVDGQLVSSSVRSVVNIGHTTGDLAIGSTSSGGEYANGSIDDVRIYNYARTPAQVAWDYNKGKPILDYKFDQCSGNTLHDSSGNGFDGIVTLGTTGVTTLGNCNQSNTAWGLGKMGRSNGSLSFDGQDDYGRNEDIAMPSTEGAFAVWLKPAVSMVSPSGIYPRLLGFSQNSGLYIQATTGNPYIQMRISGTIYSCVSPKPVVATVWQHLIGTYRQNGSNVDIAVYYNGQKVCSNSIAGTVTAQSALRISSNTPSYQGQLDDMQIYNYALTLDQIKSMYNGGAFRWGQ